MPNYPTLLVTLCIKKHFTTALFFTKSAALFITLISHKVWTYWGKCRGRKKK